MLMVKQFLWIKHFFTKSFMVHSVNFIKIIYIIWPQLIVFIDNESILRLKEK